MKFIQSWIRYIYDSSWFRGYADGMNFGKGVWRYMRLFLLWILAALIHSIVMFFFYQKNEWDALPRINPAEKLSMIAQSFLAEYPTGLVLDISQTGVVTNATWPVFFKKPGIFSGIEMEIANPYVLVIDTWAISMSWYENSFVLLTQNSIYVSKGDWREIRQFAIAAEMKDIQSVRITHEFLAEKIDHIGQYLQKNKGTIYTWWIVVWLLSAIVLSLIIAFFVWLWVAIFSFLFACIVWGIWRFLLSWYSYKKAYADTIILYTLPWMIGSYFDWDWIQKGLLLAIVTVWVFYREKKHMSWDKVAK
jgi:hypothetical protein